MRLELGEGHLDRVEIRTIGRQEEEPGSTFFQNGGGFLALVAGEIVENDHVAWLQRRGELSLNVGLEDHAVHRLVDDPRRCQAIASQARDEGLCPPMSERGFGFQTSADTSPPAQARHLRGGAGFIEKDQPINLLAHVRLAVGAPVMARFTDVSALGLGGQQRFF